MSLLAAIRRLWHSVAARSHSDVEQEFRSTLDAYQDDLIRQGLSEEQARRKANINKNEFLSFAIATFPGAWHWRKQLKHALN
jgi:hypothetical protein